MFTRNVRSPFNFVQTQKYSNVVQLILTWLFKPFFFLINIFDTDPHDSDVSVFGAVRLLATNGGFRACSGVHGTATRGTRFVRERLHNRVVIDFHTSIWSFLLYTNWYFGTMVVRVNIVSLYPLTVAFSFFSWLKPSNYFHLLRAGFMHPASYSI